MYPILVTRKTTRPGHLRSLLGALPVAVIALGSSALSVCFACDSEVAHSDPSVSASAAGTASSAEASGGGSPSGGSPGGAAGVDPEQGVRASGVRVQSVELNQAVGVALVADGIAVPASARRAPVIAGRPGLLRVSVAVDPGHEVRELEARLTLVAPEGARAVYVDRRLIVRDSSAADLGTQFHWHLEANAIRPGSSFAVGLFETESARKASVGAGSRFPETGTSPIEPWDEALRLKVVLVPVETGCGVKLVVSDAALKANRDLVFDAFPLRELQIEYRNKWRKLEGCPGGVGEIAREALEARREDNAPDDVLYAALVGPDGFAAGGALGQAFGTVGDSPYSGNGAGNDGVGTIIVHELGHNLGRPHPWEEGADYPYDDEGNYPGWGYRISSRTLVPSTGKHDVMSYTLPQWISEYTYAKCAEFLRDHPPKD